MKRTIIPIIAILLFASCGKEPPMPKPNTYLRLSVPQPKYLHYDDKNLPFTFDYPDYGEIVPVKSDDKSSIWFNIVFERYGFEANVSYVPIKTDTSLAYMVNDCYTFLDRHKKHCRFVPNNDSLAVVIKRIDTDLDNMINSLRWK